MRYPNNIKKKNIMKTNYANRGMTLESDLNITNAYYLENNIAIIYKKPTPIKIVKVVFDCKKNATIKEAYFKVPSTTDYNGIYRGKYIDFEAKEVKDKKCFPISNINIHQIKHIDSVIKHGGIAFIIVRFTTINKSYLLDGGILLNFVNSEARKSIPIEVFENDGYELKDNFLPRLNYLDIVNKIYFGGKDEKENISAY